MRSCSKWTSRDRTSGGYSKIPFTGKAIAARCSADADRPLIMEDIEDVFSVLLSTNILSMAVIAIFQILIAKCTGN
jgi:hypothetical protein